MTVAPKAPDNRCGKELAKAETLLAHRNPIKIGTRTLQRIRATSLWKITYYCLVRGPLGAALTRAEVGGTSTWFTQLLRQSAFPSAVGGIINVDVDAPFTTICDPRFFSKSAASQSSTPTTSLTDEAKRTTFVRRCNSGERPSC